MAGHSTAAVAHAGSNPFLRVVAAISTVAGWCAAAMIVVAVVVTCQMIFVRLVLNASTVWQTETVIYLVIAATLWGCLTFSGFGARQCRPVSPVAGTTCPLRAGLHHAVNLDPGHGDDALLRH